jgi:23S rRNA (guanosine2251-2'-O)-methyltransferase
VSQAIFGVHPVLEVLRAGRRAVRRVIVSEARHDRRVEQVVAAARAAGVGVERRSPEAVERLAGGGRHQGVVALVDEAAYTEPEAILDGLGETPLLVVLDGVEDPRNLGAVVRSAAAAGADGLFVPERGAAGLTAAAVKASAGSVERLPIARIGNVVAFLKRLKEKGLWVAGLDPAGTTPWSEFDLTAPLALVVGGEGRGLRRLARETCDAVLSIPLAAGVESLNLSVAAGVVLFEAVRQRRARRTTGTGSGR